MNMRLLILLATMGTGLLRADALTYTVTPSAGQFVYQFTLMNTGNTGGTLFDLFLSLPTAYTNIDAATIGVPVGWGDANGGFVASNFDTSPTTSFIQWDADFSGLYDVGSGSSLSVFSFVSSVDVGQPITFALNLTTDFATAQEVSSVPEPATWVLLVPFLVAVGLRVRFRPAPSR